MRFARLGTALPGKDQTVTTPAYATIPEACRLVGLGRSKLYQIAANGDIRFVKVGSRTVVDVPTLLDFMAARPEARITPRRDPAIVAEALLRGGA